MAKVGVWLGLSGWLALYGCGQELVLPVASGGRAAEAEAAAESGETGTAGAPDGSAAPAARLPVTEAPIYTAFGGAGGEPGAEQSGGGPSLEPDPPSSGGKGVIAVGDGGAPNSLPDAVAGAGGDPSPPGAAPVPQLLFSEYVEGSGSFKALEIQSLNAASLEGCELRTHFNGKLEPTRLALHGSLEAGGFQVLCSSALATAQPALCDRSTNLTFNGDDALALVCGSRILDVIGQIGVDPGETWGGGATADHTLRRKCEVVTGRQDGNQSFDPTSEWHVLGADTFDDLGQRSCQQP